MSIDYSVLAHAKPRPAALDRVARAKGWKRRDARESETVRRRSGGRCEVVFSSGRMAGPRCVRRAVHVHHIVGGHGARGRGRSALAPWKVHVCDRCHMEIHAHILAIDGRPGQWRFRRAT